MFQTNMQILIDQPPITWEHEMFGDNKYFAIFAGSYLWLDGIYIYFMGLSRVLYTGIDRQSSRLALLHDSRYFSRARVRDRFVSSVDLRESSRKLSAANFHLDA